MTDRRSDFRRQPRQVRRTCLPLLLSNLTLLTFDPASVILSFTSTLPKYHIQVFWIGRIVTHLTKQTILPSRCHLNTTQLTKLPSNLTTTPFTISRSLTTIMTRYPSPMSVSSIVTIITAGLLSQTPLVTAVSLSDFAPYATNLTAPCQAVYTAQIPGCNANDFTLVSSSSSPGGGSGGTYSNNDKTSCSSGCIQGMVSINSQVWHACSGVPQDNEEIVAAFLGGKGIQDLCPNVVVTTLGANNAVQTSTVTTIGEATESGQSMATVSELGGGSAVSATSTTQITMSTSMTEGIVVDPSSPTLIPHSTGEPSVVFSGTSTMSFDSTFSTASTSSAVATVTSIFTTTAHSTMSTSSFIIDTSSQISTATQNAASAKSTTAPTTTVCADAEHGASPFSYCNAAPPSTVTEGSKLAVALALIWWMVFP